MRACAIHDAHSILGSNNVANQLREARVRIGSDNYCSRNSSLPISFSSESMLCTEEYTSGPCDVSDQYHIFPSDEKVGLCFQPPIKPRFNLLTPKQLYI